MNTMIAGETLLRTSYKEQGYVIAKAVIPDEVMKKVIEDLDLAAIQILESKGHLTQELRDAPLLEKLRTVFDIDRDLYLSILRLGSKLQSVYALTMHENVMRLLGELGCRVSMLPCGVAIHVVAEELRIPGGYFGWGAHQDWCSAQGSLDQFVLWAPLMNVGRDFYPIEIIPGSHKLGVLPGDRSNANARGALITIEPGLLDENAFVPVEMERGDVVIFSGLLVHRTGSGTRTGLRIACGTRFDNLEESTFVERGYPCAFRLHAETQTLHPGFPTSEQVKRLFQ
ncbi:phytanoyl-CoA dioxygenase family protein [Nitrospira sp. Nam80]